jgi:hypothetical protein
MAADMAVSNLVSVDTHPTREVRQSLPNSSSLDSYMARLSFLGPTEVQKAAPVAPTQHQHPCSFIQHSQHHSALAISPHLHPQAGSQHPPTTDQLRHNTGHSVHREGEANT